MTAHRGAPPVSIAFAEVYVALERGVADCAITGTGSGNAAKWYEVTSHMYTLPVGWSLGACYVNLGWWNKLDPAVRKFLEDSFKEIERQAVVLRRGGADAGRDRLQHRQAELQDRHARPGTRPMVEVKPTDADQALLRQDPRRENVIPAWVKRCGARCGEIYNTSLAPITGVKYSRGSGGAHARGRPAPPDAVRAPSARRHAPAASPAGAVAAS